MGVTPFSPLRQEPSSLLAFSGNRIDRLAETRGDDAVAEALAAAGTRVLVIGGGRLHMRVSGAGNGEPYHSVQQASAMAARMEDAVLLGFTADGPVLAAPAGLAPEELPEGTKAVDFRSIYVQDLVDAEALGALAQGAALLAWHANHRFCGACGGGTEPRAGGYKRVCLGCGKEHFPRTDPVVIMLCVAGDRCLLGRGPHFVPNMYSALAGFVEPGETIENAVRREVAEEAGIAVGRVAYHASQPWPFPYSLMIGCYAEATTEEVRFDARELEDCCWFSRQEARAILAGEHERGIISPPRGAIAHELIRNWAEAG